ncbi:MAG: MFS transporter, partial [Candidatus Limnocylindrales bacterium]
MAQVKSAEQAALELEPRAKLEILGAILLALFLFALDQTVVGTALPVIVTDLHGNDLYVWVVTIYLLTSTISGPIYGKLSDLFGRRPIIIFAVSLFLIASVLSGLSQSMEQLILFRGLQGLGGGAIFPVALAVVADLYTPSERGKYLGLFGAVFGVSFLIGPAIGGLITDTVGWHWIFFVNVPIGLVSLVIISRLLPAIKRPDAAHNIDYLGAAVFAAAISLILIGLTNKGTGEWTDPAVGGLILAGLVITAVFIWIESRAADPIVPLGLFRIRNFSVS